MKVLVTFASLIAVLCCESLSADLIRYDFSGSPGNQSFNLATILDPHVTAGTLFRGSGLSSNTTQNSINSSGWSLTASIDPNDYYSFSLAPSANYQMSLSSLSFRERRSSTGIREFQIRSSLDGFSSIVPGSVISIPDVDTERDQTISLGGTFSGLTSAVEFRIYGYNAEGTTGTWRLQNHSTLGGLFIDGTTTAVPEPGSSLVLAATGFAFVVWRRTRRLARPT